MGAYQYKALDAKGRKQTGVLDGDSPRLIRQQLRAKGLTPLSVEVSSSADSPTKKMPSTSRRVRRIKFADLALITRQIATLIGAAMPVEDALRAVGQQCRKNQLKSLLYELRSQVAQGYSLSEGMRQFPRIFDSLYCSMVASGERTGHLDVVLNRLADYIEQRQQIRMKTLQALIYPSILVVVSFIVILILLTTVVPKIVVQFEYMGQQLPFSTRLLMGISHHAVSQGGWIALLLLVLAVGIKWLLKQSAWRMKWHAMSIHIPVIGRVMLEQQTARYARTLSILTASAVPLVEAMQIASGVLSNEYAKAQLNLASHNVRKGNSLLTTLMETELFSPMLLQMIASGEQTGELEQMLQRAADFQDREFSSRVSIALTIFEPTLIVSMAGIVLFIVMAIIQPILALNNMVG